VAANRRELVEAIDRVRTRYGDAWIVEEFVRGPELAMGVIGSHVLDPVAVDLRTMPGNPRVRSHEVKHGEIHYIERPKLPPWRLAELKRLTWRMHAALGARHYNRMEFIDDGNRFWLIEANPLPDISATESFLSVGCSWWGIDFATMINLVLWNAVEDYRHQSEHAERFSLQRIEPLRQAVEPGLKALSDHDAEAGPGVVTAGLVQASLANAKGGNGKSGNGKSGNGKGGNGKSTKLITSDR
jgi:hypothetical protein